LGPFAQRTRGTEKSTIQIAGVEPEKIHHECPGHLYRSDIILLLFLEIILEIKTMTAAFAEPRIAIQIIRGSPQ
jgi:hypothetical protein